MPAMGTSFGRYKVAEEIGRGAMGVVYRAVDPSIGRSVAIKAINRTYLESVGVQPGEYAERFQREAQVAGALNHPHIVKIFDLGPDYIVMEYVEGQTLAGLLRQRGRLPREVALRLLGEAASALDHAHSSGIVHRDIKPANFMVQSDGSVKVMDFGLARIESSTLTAAGEVLGSAAYMAPEVVLGQSADARSDIFSLAVVAYELLAGVRPFAGPTVSAIIQSVVRTTPRSVRELDASLQSEVDAVFTRALAKEPAARYPSAGDFAQALSAAAWSKSADAAEPLAALVDDSASSDVGEATLILATASTIRAPEPPPAPEEMTTILSVEADELAETGEVVLPVTATPAEDTSATVIIAPRAASVPEPEEEVETPATVMLRAPQAEPPVAQADPQDVVATVILSARPPIAAPAPAAADDLGAATVIVQRPVALDPTTDRLAIPLLMPPPAQAQAQESGATLRLSPTAATPPMGLPAIGPNDPTLLGSTPAMSRGPVMRPSTPAPTDTSATVSLTSDVRAQREVAPPAPAPPEPPPATRPASLPAAPPISAPPPPPPASTAPPALAAPTPVTVEPKPAAPAKSGSGVFVAGLVVVILLLFALAVGGFFWLVRSRQARSSEATPAPITESTPAPIDVPAEATPAPETPPSEAPAATPAPEAAPVADAAPRTATLTIDSEPTGASVTVGKRSRGRTPLKLTVAAGTTAVLVEKDGFKPWRETARLKAGETRTLRAQLEAVPAPRPAATAAAPPPKPAVREGDLVPAGPDVTPPRKLSGPSPNVPDKVRRNLNGSVVVSFIVDIDGSTSSARVVESLNLVVDKAALEAVAKFRFEPARVNGVRVRFEQRAKFTFSRS